MDQKFKFLGIVSMIMIALLALSGVANAAISLPIAISEVYLDGIRLSEGSVSYATSLERNQDITIKVRLDARESASNVVLTGFLSGYEYGDRESTSDATATFNVVANTTYYKTLKLSLPEKLVSDRYRLRLMLSDRANDVVMSNYEIQVDAPKNQMRISDVLFNPETSVKSGRTLLTTVRIKNVGSATEDSIKVKVAIPALDISASAYVDKLERSASTTSEELYLKIPQCATPGVYSVKVSLFYDEGYETETMTKQITIEEEESCRVAVPSTSNTEEKTIIVATSSSQNIVRGETGATYELTIANLGQSTKTYVISNDEVSWGTVKVSPNVVVLSGGESKVVSLYASASDSAALGEKAFTVQVKTGDVVAKELIFKANVKENSTGSSTQAWGSLKDALQIGLIVLVVLLVIIGIIVGFSKLKSNDDDEEDNKKYY